MLPVVCRYLVKRVCKPSRINRSTLRRRDCSIPNSLSSRESTLERESETNRAPVAKFEEWPIRNAVPKHITMDRSPYTLLCNLPGICIQNTEWGTVEGESDI